MAQIIGCPMRVFWPRAARTWAVTRRPAEQCGCASLWQLFKASNDEKPFYERAITEIKYRGYIEKQTREIEKTKKQNNKKIPKNFNYNLVEGLSNEVKEKLTQKTPRTIGNASNIEGVTPAAINLILIYLKKAELVEQNA